MATTVPRRIPFTHQPQQHGVGSGAVLGARICAIAGLAWMAWGAGALPGYVGVPVLVTSVLTAVALLRRLRGRSAGAGGPMPRAYWVTVGIEGVAIALGAVVLNVALDAPQAIAGWIALVVGLHFFGLARIWPGAGLPELGAVVTASGVAGLIAAAAGADVAVATAVAALPAGLALLGSAALVSRRL